ncbi:transposase [Streptomyces rochei]
MRLSASLLVCLGMGTRQPRPWIVSDELWSLVEPLPPKPGPKKVQGRPRVPDRRPCAGSSSCCTPASSGSTCPQELGFGSGMTCWRRLAAWNDAGVWDQLHQLLLNELRSKGRLDWERAVIDSSHVRAARRGPKADPARSTAHGRAASTTSSSTARASRSRYR